MIRKRAQCLLACGTFSLGLLAGSPVSAHAAQVEDFPLSAPIMGSDYGVPARVPLPREILSRTSSSLKDIRIFDDLGREVTFLTDVSGRSAPESIRWEIQSSQAIGEEHVFLLGRGADMGSVDELTVLSEQTWACSDIEVFSGMDGLLWSRLATGRVANLKPGFDVRRMTIGLPETHAPFLKVVFRRMKREDGVNPLACLDRRGRETDLSDPLPFTAVQGFVSRIFNGNSGGTAFDEEVVDEFDKRLDSQGNTVVDLAGVSLPVKEVALGFGQACFYRDVFILSGGNGEGASYELKASGGVYRVPGLGLSQCVLKADIGSAPRIRIRIRNNGEPPLGLNRITLRWPRTHLLFVPQKGRRYRVYYGAADLKSGTCGQGITPGGDVKALWKVGAPVVNESYRPVSTGGDDFRRFFIFGMIILVIYCLGFWVMQIRKLMARR